MGTVRIEKRAYGLDSSTEEILAIKSRVYLHAPGVIMYREMPVQSVFQLGIFEEKMNELAEGLDEYALLIDLTEADPPGADIRARLKTLFSGQTKMKKTAVFTGRNFMLNVAAKFVLGGIGLKTFSVHKTMEQALAALEEK